MTDTVDDVAARRMRRRLLRKSLEVGEMIGRYRIVSQLGAGGMGVVYRAHDADLGRDVAVKLVTVGETPTDTLASRLMREAQALAQLNHPNVVAVYDVGRVEGGVFLAMELVPGETGEAWNKRKPKWREALAVFRDAGRGLAAAHKVGLVHRDFKPANLILGSDGRVRVLDFGLARAAQMATSGEMATIEGLGDEATTWSGESGDQRTRERVDTPPTGEMTRDELPPPKLPPPKLAPAPPVANVPEPMSDSGRSSGRLLETPLTQVGAIVGTPPYMAPEQHLGGGCDARTDQFSFCVAFYQALYGERPFDGANYAELSSNIIKGKLRPLPAHSPVPSWLRAIVLRGLEVVPEKRWPSMDAILEAMANDPAARWRRLARWAAVAALVAVAGVATWRSFHAASTVCKGAEAELAGVWDPSRRAAVQATFGKSSKPYAADAFAAVARALDAYTGGWVAMHTDACAATRVRGTQSAELMDLRMECLQQRLDAVRAQVDLFASADDEVVSRAAEMSRKLPPLGGCADAEALRAPLRPPADAGVRKRVEATRKTLATVRALWDGGRYAEAQKRMTPALADARALGYRPLEGEALLMQARIADSMGDYPTAARALRDAAVAAEAGRHDEVAALAETLLVWVTGERMGKYAEAQELARSAQAKIDRLGHADLLQAELDASVAALFLEQGKYKEGEERSKRVLALREKVLQPNDMAIAGALGDLGDAAVQLGHYKEAIERYQRAIVIAEHAVGGEHPKLGNLHVNLGAALRSAGRIAEALVEYKRAQGIVERSLGRDHPMLASIDLNVGAVLLDQGREGEAAVQFKRAIEISTKALGPDHPTVGTAWYRLGNVAIKQGRAAEARAYFQKAFDIWAAKLGAEHPTLSAALDGLGDAMLAEGKTAAAMAYYKRALALLEKTVGPKHPDLADALVGIGLCELASNAPRRAVASLERAVALRESGGEAIDTARARFALARALAATGDRVRALALADEARAVYAKGDVTSARELVEIDRWLKILRPRH